MFKLNRINIFESHADTSHFDNFIVSKGVAATQDKVLYSVRFQFETRNQDKVLYNVRFQFETRIVLVWARYGYIWQNNVMKTNVSTRCGEWTEF